MAPRLTYALSAAAYNVRTFTSVLRAAHIGYSTSSVRQCLCTGLLVPGTDGSIADVVLGFDDMKSLTVSVYAQVLFRNS